MVRTPCFHCRVECVDSIPGQGTKIPQAAQVRPKKKKKRKERKKSKYYQTIKQSEQRPHIKTGKMKRKEICGE